MKKIVKSILHKFGYQITKISNSPINVFDLQNILIKVQEPVIFDIGAYHGSVTQIYRKLFPLSSIYCFEPFPQSFQKLSKIVEKDSRTSCYNIAITQKTGSAILNENLSHATNSLLETDKKGASFWGNGLLDTVAQVNVKTKSIDDFCLETGISHIDILKMDVQGAEYSVLLGARKMLANQNISLIYTELIMCPTYKGQQKLHKYLSFLDDFGYSLMDIFNPVKRNLQLIQADVVFLSASIKNKIGKNKK